MDTLQHVHGLKFARWIFRIHYSPILNVTTKLLKSVSLRKFFIGRDRIISIEECDSSQDGRYQRNYADNSMIY